MTAPGSEIELEDTSSTLHEPEEGLAEVTVEQLPQRLRTAAEAAGWTTLMPVQARGIPYLLAAHDMIVQARTGSGKTGAFLLPMLELLDASKDQCQALVLVPTRELARQVADDAEKLCSAAGFRSVVVYGGVGYTEQREGLKGGSQIVIGTPGRVLDHLLKRTFTLEHLKLLVFDEADRMLSMGFYPDMKQVQRYLPTSKPGPKRKLQTCMFSATFPPYVLRTAHEFIPEPEFLTLSRDHVHVSDVDHVYYQTPGMDKDRALIRIIELENPASAIIFCNTKSRVHYLNTVIQRFGYDADEISADLSQNDRERVLKRVREGSLRFLIATDVAARGLDIPELSHVFQFEPPEDPEAYVHRAGRTGRAGASGTAISLVTPIEKLEINRIAQRYSINMQERPLPTDEDVAAAVTERLTAHLEARLRKLDSIVRERARRFVPLARELAENEEESDIMAMLLDDLYHQLLHVPQVQPTADRPAPKPAAEKPGRPRPPRGGKSKEAPRTTSAPPAPAAAAPAEAAKRDPAHRWRRPRG